MAALELALVLLVVVLASAVLDQLIPHVSLPLIQIGCGIAVAIFAQSQISITLNPDLFLVLFIAPLLFDEARLPLERLLAYYFLTIDSTSVNRQGEDEGPQYRTGIYYDRALIDEADLKEVEAIYYSEKGKHERFYTEFKPLECFYPAEEYHQKYLVKNPSGYCHFSLKQFAPVKALN